MKPLVVLLTPEVETLWIRRPELLLLTDKALLDKNDFKRIIDRANRSEFDSKVSALLKAYADEGYVEIVDYKSVLKNDERISIYNYSQRIIADMSLREKKLSAIYGHDQFANYLGAKLEHLNSDEPLFKRLAKARRKILDNVAIIKQLPDIAGKYPSHVSEMQRRAIAKWLAAEMLARKFKSDFIFDLDEYRPYAKRIRETILIDKTPEYIKTLFPSDYDAPFRVLWNVVKTQLPGISLDSVDDIPRFRPSRKEFEAFRRVLRDLVQYHEEVGDDQILYKYAERRFKDAQDEVRQMFNRVPRRFLRCLPSGLAYLLNKIYIPASSDSIKKHLEKSQAKDIFNRAKNAYQKLCCFSMYASRQPLPRALARPEPEENDGRHWITGAPLSWYESPKQEAAEH